MKKTILYIGLSILFCTNSIAQLRIINGNFTACSDDEIELTTTDHPSYKNPRWYKEVVSAPIHNGKSMKIQKLSPRFHNYIYMVDSANVTLSDTAQIFIFDNPNVELGNDLSTCYGQTVTLQDKDQSSGKFDYYWNTTTKAPSIDVKNKGWYRVVKKGPFPSPCTAVDSVFVDVKDKPAMEVKGATQLCEGDNLDLEITIIDPDYSLFHLPSYFTANGNKLTGEALKSEYLSYDVIDNNNPNCFFTDSVKIEVSPKINIEDFPTLHFCRENFPATIDAPKASGGTVTSDYTYYWQNTALSTGKSLNIVAKHNTQIKLEVKDDFGCSATQTTVVTNSELKHELSDLSFLSLCEGVNIEKIITPSGNFSPFSFRWKTQNNANYKTSYDLSYQADDSLYMELSDSKGCKLNDSIKVIKNQEVAINSLPYLVSQNGKQIKIELHDYDAYDSYKAKTSFASSITPTNYGFLIEADDSPNGEIEIEVNNNCIPFYESIMVETKGNILYIPNTVIRSSTHPDVNTLKVYSETLSEQEFFFAIYNQYGDVVYETDNLPHAVAYGWEGEDIQHNSSPTAIYTYYLSGYFADGQFVEKRGTITLIE